MEAMRGKGKEAKTENLFDEIAPGEEIEGGDEGVSASHDDGRGACILQQRAALQIEVKCAPAASNINGRDLRRKGGGE